MKESRLWKATVLAKREFGEGSSVTNEVEHFVAADDILGAMANVDAYYASGKNHKSIEITGIELHKKPVLTVSAA